MGERLRMVLAQAAQNAQAGAPVAGPKSNSEMMGGFMPGIPGSMSGYKGPPQIGSAASMGGGGGMRIAQPAPNPQQQAQINRTHPPQNKMVGGPTRQATGGSWQQQAMRSGGIGKMFGR